MTILSTEVNILTKIISVIETFLGDITLYLFFALFLFMFLCDIKTFLKMVWMVLKIYRSDHKQKLIHHVNFLLKTDSEFVEKITSFEYFRTWYNHQLDETVKKYTEIPKDSGEYGIIAKKKAKYYTDLQKACVENKESLDVIAFSVALSIAQEIDIYGKESYIIVGQAGGNILLASRVATILGLRFVIVGNLAGKKDNIFGTYYGAEKAIFVDDVLFTGTSMIEGIKTLNSHNIQCNNVFVALIRSYAYQEPVACYIKETNNNIEVKAVRTYLDCDMDKFIGNEKGDKS